MNRTSISGRTRVAAVIGHPIEHSLSPTIHNAGFESLDVDWAYVALDVDVDGLANVLRLCRGGALAGLSVTMPLKTATFDALDSVSPSAEMLRSVNTVSCDDEGRLQGHSTDGDGLVDSLIDEGVVLSGRSVLVLGWGGAARSVVDALRRHDVERVGVANRSGVPEEELQRIAGPSRSIEWTARHVAVSEHDVVINCTSLGMGADGTSPIDPDAIPGDVVVVDLVYHPLETPLMRAASANGCQVVGGLGMLVHQAARQQEIWLGTRPDTSVMRVAALRALAERR